MHHLRTNPRPFTLLLLALAAGCGDEAAGTGATGSEAAGPDSSDPAASAAGEQTSTPANAGAPSPGAETGTAATPSTGASNSAAPMDGNSQPSTGMSAQTDDSAATDDTVQADDSAATDTAATDDSAGMGAPGMDEALAPGASDDPSDMGPGMDPELPTDDATETDAMSGDPDATETDDAAQSMDDESDGSADDETDTEEQETDPQPDDGEADDPGQEDPALDDPEEMEPVETDPEEMDPPGACTGVSGDFGVVNATIVVQAGQTYDGQCQRFWAGPGVGDGSQDENQDPVFRLESGARLVNVVLGAPAADGIHVHGDGTLENIVWEDIGEDALTIKESGVVVLNGGSARNASDKIFQVNAASTFRISNFTASNGGKFIRQNGDTTFEVQVFVDGCDISNLDESIFRTDSNTSSLTMSNTRYSNIGEVFRRGGDRNAAWNDAGGNSTY